MTLVARAAPPAYHKKASGKHHRRSKTYHKTYWPYLPLLLVVLGGVILNSALPGKHAVLGYATDMSIQSLLNDTNAQRDANSEAGLSLNAQLDSAAQAKANDMAARNYWSHNTPDGQTPWSFMTAAGYNYSTAGENLAYGFATANDTITGWMNSPEHRANILNAGFKEVGFGFINITDYQSSGPQTLVVAMYGAQASVPAAVASTPSPAPKTSAQPTSSAAPSSAAGGSATQPTTTPATPISPPSDNHTSLVTPSKTTTPRVIATRSISRAQILTAGEAPWSMVVVSLAGSLALIAFLLRHGIAWHKVVIRGEKFLLHHPLLDLALLSLATLAFVMSQHAGVIR